MKLQLKAKEGNDQWDRKVYYHPEIYDLEKVDELEEDPMEYVSSDLFLFLDDKSTKILTVVSYPDGK